MKVWPLLWIWIIASLAMSRSPREIDRVWKRFSRFGSMTSSEARSLGRDFLVVGNRRIVVLDVAGGPAGPGGVLLPAEDRPDDVLGGDRGAVVVRDRDQPIGQRPAQGRLQRST